MPIHLRCEQNVAPIVFLPGDPMRAKWIAERFLESPKLTTSYRQMLGYTGTFNGHAISIQTTGMGGPSAAIVCEELRLLGAKFFIRVGTCGALNDRMHPGDLVLATAACMFDGASKEIFKRLMHGTTMDVGFVPTSDFEFLSIAQQKAKTKGIQSHLGPIASADLFYGHPESTYQKLADLGILAVEMEASVILTMAAKFGIRAAAMMTVSDLVFGAQRTSEEVIEEGVERMLSVGIESAIQAMA